MIKLIVTDMDGTLLDDSKNFPPDFLELVKKLKSKDVQFAIASGRQYYTLLEQFFEIKDDLIFISANGTYVAHQDELIYEDTMANSDVLKLIRVGRTIKNAFMILCGKSSAYTESADVAFLEHAKQYFARLEVVENIELVEDDFIQFTMCDFEDSETNSYAALKQFEHELKVAISGKMWIDVMNKTANKGIAVEKIQRDINITFDETLVFGDYLNDLEMMAVAKYSYAIKNAHPDILKASSFVTQFDNNECGVTKTIRQLLFPETPAI